MQCFALAPPTDVPFYKAPSLVPPTLLGQRLSPLPPQTSLAPRTSHGAMRKTSHPQSAPWTQFLHHLPWNPFYQLVVGRVTKGSQG